MESRRAAAKDAVVKFLREQVVDLKTSFGRVTKITTDVKSYHLNLGDKTILASGGWTSNNMEQWSIPSLSESHQPETVVIMSFERKLSGEELEKVKGLSIFSVIGQCKAPMGFEWIFKLTIL